MPHCVEDELRLWGCQLMRLGQALGGVRIERAKVRLPSINTYDLWFNERILVQFWYSWSKKWRTGVGPKLENALE